MAERPWSKFFWSDWEADQGLRLCSLSAQGLWMRILCVCARHEPKGYLAINGNPLTVDAIARLAGIAETEAETLLAELDRNGVFSRNRSGTIYSRRMIRDEKTSQEGRKHKKRGLAQANEIKGKNPEPSRGPLRIPDRGASPHMPEAREKEEPNGSSKKRGSRIPPDWRLPQSWGGWAVSQGLSEAEVEREADRFGDYWRAKPGTGGTKLDWEATWRNWIRTALEKKPTETSPRPDPARTFLRKIAGGSK